MGMLEISERRGGREGLGSAFKDFKESLECLKEDFETLWEEMESMGERGGMSSGGGYSGGGNGGGSYGNRYYDEDEEIMGERRGVRGSGRGRRRR